MNNESSNNKTKKSFLDHLTMPGMIVLLVVIGRTLYRGVAYNSWTPF